MVSEKDEGEDKLKEKASKISILEGSAYAVSDGFGFRNITPYALALGASNSVIGILSSVPSLLGNLFQLVSSRLIGGYSRKKIVLFAVFLQALMWLFMLVPGFLYFYYNIHSSALLVIVYTSLVVFGAFGGPAWSSWMRDIIPKKIGRYFAKRNKIAGSISLVFMLLSGFILDYFKQTNIFIAFIILFGFSFLFRSISGLLFVKQYEPKFNVSKKKYFTFSQFFKKMPFNNFGKFTMFISLLTLAVSIASPFFSVYMLKELGFSYSVFMIVNFADFLVILLSIKFWGKFADSYGNIKVLRIAGFFTTLIPLLWVFTLFFRSNFYFLVFYLISINALSGFVWSGFNLASGNFVFNAVTRDRHALCVSYFNVLNGFGVFVGALLGGLLASLNIGFWIFSGLVVVFIISFIARISIYLMFVFKIREVVEVKGFEMEDTFSSFNFLRFFSHHFRFLKSRGAE